jgi:hypothetical protein
MAYDEIKFEYSLEDGGWAKITFEIAGNKFEYLASYTYCTLDQIFGIAVDVLDRPVKEGFNSFFISADSSSVRSRLLVSILSLTSSTGGTRPLEKLKF